VSKFGFSIIGNVYWKRYICIQNERESILECRNIVKGETGTSEVGSEISNRTGGIYYMRAKASQTEPDNW
jgi:hypothetical protein